MHVFNLLLSIILVVNGVDEVASDCILSLHTDFGKPQPVFIQNGRLLAPSDNGSVIVSSSEALIVGCVGNGRMIVLGNLTTLVSIAEAHCVSKNIFKVGAWKGPFVNIICNMPPWYTSEFTGMPCFSGNEIIRVGYKVRGNFYTLYEACFDINLLTTSYVRHSIGPGSSYIQGGGRKRPQFIDEGIFGDTAISEIYKLKNQKDILTKLLGYSCLNCTYKYMYELYLSKNQFLTRGHLAPRGDFSLRSAQRASFHYINVAPQWLRGNSGDWAALEEAIRRRITEYGKWVTIYTGTYDVTSLPDAKGNLKELYLSVDQNNNPIVPVPLYFYKVIYDPEENSAVVFISINSSTFNGSLIDELTFCYDVCEDNPNFKWLKWRPNDGTHSFCCNYQDFKEKVPHLPPLKVNKMFS